MTTPHGQQFGRSRFSSWSRGPWLIAAGVLVAIVVAVVLLVVYTGGGGGSGGGGY
jgi:hypothetical protein